MMIDTENKTLLLQPDLVRNFPHCFQRDINKLVKIHSRKLNRFHVIPVSACRKTVLSESFLHGFVLNASDLFVRIDLGDCF